MSTPRNSPTADELFAELERRARENTARNIATLHAQIDRAAVVKISSTSNQPPSP